MKYSKLVYGKAVEANIETKYITRESKHAGRMMEGCIKVNVNVYLQIIEKSINHKIADINRNITTFKYSIAVGIISIYQLNSNER